MVHKRSRKTKLLVLGIQSTGIPTLDSSIDAVTCADKNVFAKNHFYRNLSSKAIRLKRVVQRCQHKKSTKQIHAKYKYICCIYFLKAFSHLFKLFADYRQLMMKYTTIRCLLIIFFSAAYTM